MAQISSSIEIAQLMSEGNERVVPHLASAALSNQQVWNLIERASQATDGEAFVRRFEPRVADLEALIVDQVKAFQQSNSGVEFRLESDGPITCRFDETQIKEALSNLLDNAASFANDGSTVEITLKVKGATAVVQVSNHGPTLGGDGEELFGPFVSTRASPPGSHRGLGLYLVRLIAEQHGGSSTIANRPNGLGVTATITLPLWN